MTLESHATQSHQSQSVRLRHSILASQEQQVEHTTASPTTLHIVMWMKGMIFVSMVMRQTRVLVARMMINVCAKVQEQQQQQQQVSRGMWFSAMDSVFCNGYKNFHRKLSW